MLTREHYILGRRRIRRVLDYLEQHLDEDCVSLASLADIAHLSRYHFERTYRQKVGETPMSTLRRLRLARARQILQAGTARSITDVALQAGYGSIAAFSRAFSRAFACAPSAVETVTTPFAPAPVALDIVEVPALPVWRLPFSGPAAEVFPAGDELSWHMARSGARAWRHWVVHPDGWIDPARWSTTWVRMWHCVPRAGQPPQVPGAEQGTLPGGMYARFRFVGETPIEVPELIARVHADTAWRVVEGPMLRHFPNVPDYAPPSERCSLFFLPLAR